MSDQYRPKNHNSVSPYLIVPDVKYTLDFLTVVFNAEVLDATRDKAGNINHGSVKIDDSVIMMGRASDQFKALPCMTHIYVPDVDATFQKALDQGATPMMEPADQFYGDRSGGVKDKYGFMWWMATNKEQLSPEELQKRAREAKG